MNIQSTIFRSLTCFALCLVMVFCIIGMPARALAASAALTGVGVAAVVAIPAILCALGMMPRSDNLSIFRDLSAELYSVISDPWKSIKVGFLNMMRIGNRYYADEELLSEILSTCMGSGLIAVSKTLDYAFLASVLTNATSSNLDILSSTIQGIVNNGYNHTYYSILYRTDGSFTFFFSQSPPDCIYQNGGVQTLSFSTYSQYVLVYPDGSFWKNWQGSYNAGQTIYMMGTSIQYGLLGKSYSSEIIQIGNLAEDLEAPEYEEWKKAEIIEFPGSGGSGDDEQPKKHLPVVIPPSPDYILDYTQEELQTPGDSSLTPDQVVETDIEVEVDVENSPGVDSGTTAPAGFFDAVLERLAGIWDAVLSIPEVIVSIPQTISIWWNETVSPYWEYLYEGLTWLGNEIIALPQTISDLILAGIQEIFVPSEDYLSVKVDALVSRFGFAESIVFTGQGIMNALSGFDTEPPIIYAELQNAEGEIDWGDRVPILDLRWYERYKPTVDILISGFIWACFAWRFFVRLPGFISGMPGDFVVKVIRSGSDSHSR